MAGLCAPLSTLRQYPQGYLRMTRGRCGSLLLHRDGLAPSTPCRSPGALRSAPMNRHRRYRSACLKGAKTGHADQIGQVGFEPKPDYCTARLFTLDERTFGGNKPRVPFPPKADLTRRGFHV